MALLELNRTGQPASVALRESAEEAAQGLLEMARHIAAADAEADDDAPH